MKTHSNKLNLYNHCFSIMIMVDQYCSYMIMLNQYCSFKIHDYCRILIEDCMLHRVAQPYEKWYLVNQRWWTQWIMAVESEGSASGNLPVGVINNSNLIREENKDDTPNINVCLSLSSL